MTEILATSPNVSEELRAANQEALQGPDDSTPASVRMLRFLLSGQADRLTGRHIPFDESIDNLIRRADKIVQDDLYALRLRV